jgi:hypothetical protein
MQHCNTTIATSTRPLLALTDAPEIPYQSSWSKQTNGQRHSSRDIDELLSLGLN